MLRSLAAASAIALIAIAAQAQDQAGSASATAGNPEPASPPSASPQALSETSSSVSSSSSDPAPAPSPPDSSSASSSSAPPVTGTSATIDFPGATPPANARLAVTPPDKKILRKLNEAVVAYVRNQRGWMDGTYTVAFYGYDDKLTVMEVDLTHGDNAYNFVSAEGQPFKVEIDPATFTVVAERY